jgi:nicotinamide-nucleotide amidase
MKAEIIAVGTELLLGEIVNTNASFLASSLKDLGVDHHYQTVVGDNPERLSQVIRIALQRSDFLIFTGGIGPTPDDLTHETISKTFGLELVEFPEVLTSMEALFKSRGKTMSQSNRKQALLPRSSELLANPIGTAWGIWLAPEPGKVLVTMPGVPTEMKKMWEEQIVPRLVPSGISPVKVHSRNFRLCGIPESKVAEMLGSYLNSDQPSVATYAEISGVRVRAATRSEVSISQVILDKFENDVMIPMFSDYVYSTDGSALEKIVGEMLLAGSQTLATGESCTGGQISKMLTDVAGSSKWFLGGVAAYTDAVKNQLLGVPKDILDRWGAVSKQVAYHLAIGTKETFKSDWSLSTTGFAGPASHGSSEEVGLVYIGIAGPKGFYHVSEHRFGSSVRRDAIRLQASVVGLNLLRLALKSSSSLPPSLSL